MLDIKYIRENLALFKQTAKNKNIKVDFEQLLTLDDKRKALNQQIEQIRNEKNKISKMIANLANADREKALAEMKDVDGNQKGLEDALTPVMAEYTALMYQVPMLTDSRTPVGEDERGNVELEKVGELPQFDFKPRSHEELAKMLDIVDFERGVKIAGSRSYILKGDGARLKAAVIKYAIDFIARRNFTLMDVPVLVNQFTLYGSGHFPGAEEETYYLEKDDKYLVGTSEVSIGAYHYDEILKEEQLPIRYAGISPCFRREAGSYGKDTHGLYRVHQFDKVEQFIICKNDDAESEKLHEELLNNSKEFLQSLGLSFRVLNICTGDMGRGKYYMNDIETWMPSRNSYGETHSCSTLHDFQSRRLNLRYKDAEGKIKFCHTLNNTVVASPRILIPLLESYQDANGSIRIPDVLRPYMDNQEIISVK